MQPLKCLHIDMDINALNVLSYEEFVNIFGNVVEKCPIITAAVWSKRPFVNLSALEAAINEFIDALPESGEAQTYILLTSCHILCFSSVEVFSGCFMGCWSL